MDVRLTEVATTYCSRLYSAPSGGNVGGSRYLSPVSPSVPPFQPHLMDLHLPLLLLCYFLPSFLPSTNTLGTYWCTIRNSSVIHLVRISVCSSGSTYLTYFSPFDLNPPSTNFINSINDIPIWLCACLASDTPSDLFPPVSGTLPFLIDNVKPVTPITIPIIATYELDRLLSSRGWTRTNATILHPSRIRHRLCRYGSGITSRWPAHKRPPSITNPHYLCLKLGTLCSLSPSRGLALSAHCTLMEQFNGLATCNASLRTLHLLIHSSSLYRVLPKTPGPSTQASPLKD
ncbi:hypothetical protein CCUS01_04426 [Colletotrichum cuscutae]|uniref:Uncharacterized protein n=1 Tax=Colletotrichum cuscutae TaxID=1209917 RepID=A0AAI9VC63_9PEZI|nr:hypothetical protein CCUS01_04426 [Colletotrichum cuscutae]